MYDAVSDPYCYAGTTVLRNRAGLRVQADLDLFEAEATAQRFSEPLPMGGLGVRHYCAIHRHIFQDVYTWAGRFRTVRIAKGGNPFCFPENIKKEMNRLFARLAADRRFEGLDGLTFSRKSAHFLAELNAIHAFREGNGRAQLAFLTLLAARAGHPLDLQRLDPDAMLDAMVASFYGEEAALANTIQDLID